MTNVDKTGGVVFNKFIIRIFEVFNESIVGILFSVCRKKESGLSVASKWLILALIFAPSLIKSNRAFFRPQDY
jgi:hypothetical protein